MTYCLTLASPLGELLLLAKPNSLLGLYFADYPHAPAPKENWVKDANQPIFEMAREELERYWKNPALKFHVPFELTGTPFQRRIWQIIAGIPLGQTITYTELAQRAGVPGAVRAAGTATGQNPISIIIPCHRVIGKNGSLTGYAGGLERKQRLLQLESLM